MTLTARPFESLRQKKWRIQLAVWAYAYEVEHDSLAPDWKYDSISRMIKPEVATDRPDLDAWFREHFMADSGMWIHGHPELKRIKEIYRSIKGRR